MSFPQSQRIFKTRGGLEDWQPSLQEMREFVAEHNEQLRARIEKHERQQERAQQTSR
jgi:hypothetical protein